MQDEKDLELKDAVETEEEKIEEEAIEAEEKLEEAAEAEEEKINEIEAADEKSSLADDFGEFADLEKEIEVQKTESKKIVSSAKDANYASGFPNWYLEPPLD